MRKAMLAISFLFLGFSILSFLGNFTIPASEMISFAHTVRMGGFVYGISMLLGTNSANIVAFLCAIAAQRKSKTKTTQMALWGSLVMMVLVTIQKMF